MIELIFCVGFRRARAEFSEPPRVEVVVSSERWSEIRFSCLASSSEETTGVEGEWEGSIAWGAGGAERNLDLLQKAISKIGEG